jgi:hypothetical protein
MAAASDAASDATSVMTRAGVVVAGDADGSWAWAASHVAPAGHAAPEPPAAATAEPATVHNEHSGQAQIVVQAGQVLGGVHVHGDRQPAPDDSAWLRSCWEAAAEAGAVIEMRYLTRPGAARLDGYLVMRADGADQDEAAQRVAALRDRGLPSRLVASPVTDEAETRRILEPFRVHGDGIAEVCKRLTVQRTTRDDARRRWLTAVTPLYYRRQSWDDLWSELAALPFRAMVSVGLVPFPVGSGLRAHLAAQAAELARLATQGPSPTAGWRVPRPPDEFAAAAVELMSDAVRRYTREAFHLRVSIAAERPVPAVLAELVAGTISARHGHHGFAGAPPVVVRPGPADLRAAWDDITALNVAPSSPHTQGHPAEAIGDLERTLSALVDLDEAAAAFRLPYRGSAPKSPFAAPVVSRTSAS